MPHYRKKTDANQKDIVAALRAIPGVDVATDHHDIIVGYRGHNYWYEIKRPEAMRKDGTEFSRGSRQSGRTQRRQNKLAEHWPGHYRIVSTLQQILDDLGIPGRQSGG